MLICKDCIIRHGWQPGEKTEGDCELCWDRDVTVFVVAEPKRTELSTAFDVPMIVKLGSEIISTSTEKVLDKAEQFDYNRACDSLLMFFESGPRAGLPDYDTTENYLNQIEVSVNRETDWKATYKRRLRAKHSYMKTQERLRGY